MNTNNRSPDRRRFGPIETRFRQLGRIALYELTILGERWACVEWSPERRAWCIQDASGRCLAHCDAIHGTDVDATTAVRLAKRMILDGRMPTPEEAAEQLRARLDQDQLGEPWVPLRERGEAQATAPAGRRYNEREEFTYARDPHRPRKAKA